MSHSVTHTVIELYSLVSCKLAAKRMSLLVKHNRITHFMQFVPFIQFVQFMYYTILLANNIYFQILRYCSFQGIVQCQTLHQECRRTLFRTKPSNITVYSGVLISFLYLCFQICLSNSQLTVY